MSRLKSLPIPREISFKLPPVGPTVGAVAVMAAGVMPSCCSCCCGAGVETPEGVLLLLLPRAGVPKRSTLSRATDMMALPNVVGSKRACRFDVLTLAAVESEPRPDARFPAAPMPPL